MRLTAGQREKLESITRVAVGPDPKTLAQELSAWTTRRQRPTLNWHFTTADARVKLRSLYPHN